MKPTKVRTRGATARPSGRRPAAAPTVASLIGAVARRFERAALCYGHGTDNARDEAASLVFHAAGLDHADAPAAYVRPVAARAVARLETLVSRRIEERIPAPYLTGRIWFAGHEIRVDRRALVPRSPLAEFIVARGAPFIRPRQEIRRILDLGTGSGCIAIAAARAWRRAQVDASDLSQDALDLAAENIRRHRLGRRVTPRRADVYAGLGRARYDLILANPPYVPARVAAALPAEYHHEPAGGLAAGRDGLAVVRRILAGAADHLSADGVLVCEVGDTARALERAYPKVPFLWLEFEHGGGGVFLLEAATIRRHRAQFAAAVTRPAAGKKRVR
jgi:ribosomal protein L3 glutamine methyltransferase